MEECLERITNWFVRGTLTQFQVAAEHRLSGDGYAVEKDGDALLFHRVHTKGGFLGVGKKIVKEPVMRIGKGDGGAYISPEPLDPEFVRYLADYLAQSSSSH